jgi:hypothetical protein
VNTDNALNITNPSGPTATINLKSPFTINGSVGIGTTAPHHQLRLSGGPAWTTNNWLGELELENASAMAWRANPAGNRFGIGATAGGLCFFTTSSDPGTTVSAANYRMVVADNGNIGIGTLTPTSKLEIAAQDGLAITGYQPFLTLRDASSGNSRGVIQGVTGGLNFFTNSYLGGTNPTGFMTLNNNGNVGIGTATPNTAKLEARTTVGIGVWGVSALGYGTVGNSTSSYGVTAYSENNDGLVAQTNHPDHTALYAQNMYGSVEAFLGNRYTGLETYNNGTESYAVLAAPTTGVLGVSGTGPAPRIGVNGIAFDADADWAGYFGGDVFVTGSLSGGLAVDVQIDHPRDPEGKYLKYSCIASNERLVIYSGTVQTDARGEASVTLPSYFQETVVNYRYQLTIVGGEFAQSRISREIDGNRFSIQTDKPDIKVSWQVTGDRSDAFAKAKPFVSEVDKTGDERGRFLRPDFLGRPRDQRIGVSPLLQKTHRKEGVTARPDWRASAPGDTKKGGAR